MESHFACQPFLNDQTDGDGVCRHNAVCLHLLRHFAVSLRTAESLQHGFATGKYCPLGAGTLSASILKGDIPEAESILKRIQPAGIVSRADVVLPNQFRALRMSFIPERSVPMMVMRLFELPVQIPCLSTPGKTG